jgi:hypothetical protein
MVILSSSMRCGKVAALLLFFPFLCAEASAKRALRSEESSWRTVLLSLQNKQGEPPRHIRSHERRSPDDGYKDLKTVIEETATHAMTDKDPLGDHRMKHTPSSSSAGQLDTIESFQKKMETLKRDIAKEQMGDSVGQVMRGESAKRIYLAQSGPKYDTVEGFSSKLQQKNPTNSTAAKKSEIVILKSMPKSMCLLFLQSEPHSSAVSLSVRPFLL